MFYWNDTFRSLESLRDEIFRGFDTVLGCRPQLAFLPGTAARSYPLVNIAEDGEAVRVQALAPGIDPEKLEIDVAGSQLTIAGEKLPSAPDVKPEAWHRSERATGRFARVLELPAEVEADQAEAHYKNGILEIVLPKAESARPRRIAVSQG